MALVVLATLLAFVALFAIWINRQVLNTDNWTKSSSEMLERPVIRDQVAAYLTDQVYANVDVAGQLESLLPEQAKALAVPAATALRGQVQKVAAAALERPRVQALWENANRASHEQLLNVLHGGGDVVGTNNGEVTLDLHALLEETEQRIGVGERLAGVLPESAGKITVLQSDQLGTAQDVGKAVEHLPVIAVVLSLVCFGAALLVAPRWRRNAVRAFGIGLVIAGAGTLLAETWAEDQVVSSLATTATVEPTIRAVWGIYTPLLNQAAAATIFYGAFLFLGAWLAGTTGWATGLRRAGAPYLREPMLAYCAFAAFVAIVILWWAPTPAMRNPATALVLIALFALGYEALRRRTANEFPDAERPDLVASGRERMVRARAAVAGGSRGGGDAVVRRASSFTPQPAGGDDDRLQLLERAEALHRSGVLDDAEFRAEKARILAGNGAGNATQTIH